MENVDKWGVDIFRIADLTANRPLTVITYTLLQVGQMRFWRVTYRQRICIARYMLRNGPMSVCLLQASITSKDIDGSSWCSAQRLPAACHTLCFNWIRVCPIIRLLPWGTLSQTLNFRFSPRLIHRSMLSPSFGLRKFITSSAHFCLQHIGCDTERRAVSLRRSRLVIGYWQCAPLFTK